MAGTSPKVGIIYVRSVRPSHQQKTLMPSVIAGVAAGFLSGGQRLALMNWGVRMNGSSNWFRAVRTQWIGSAFEFFASGPSRSRWTGLSQARQHRCDPRMVSAGCWTIRNRSFDPSKARCSINFHDLKEKIVILAQAYLVQKILCSNALAHQFC